MIGNKCVFFTAVALLYLQFLTVCAETIHWQRQFGTSATDIGNSVSADSLGNIFVTGTTQGSLGGSYAGGNDIFTTKFNAAGALQWSRQFGTSANDRGLSNAADGLGNVYATGYSYGNFGGIFNDDAQLLKYNSAGVLQWTRQFGTDQHDRSLGVAIDELGNAYVSGYTQGSLGGTNAGSADAFLRKYDSSGTIQWTRQLGTNAFDFSNGVATDGLGHIYIAGGTNGSLAGANAGDTDAFLSKYDAAGNLQWTRQIGTSAFDSNRSVAADLLGNVFVTGSTAGDLGGTGAGSYDGYISKYDSSGALQWIRQFGSSHFDESVSVTTDGLGGAIISGYTAGSLFGPHIGSTNFYDAFVSKYDSAGSLVWARQLGTRDFDLGNGVSADGLGNVYLTGSTAGVIAPPSSGNYDAFLIKFGPIPEPATIAVVIVASPFILRRSRFSCVGA
jgi:hypothetical protein